MVLERDPNVRRRLDGQEMLGRDQEVARLRELNVPFREIAKRLGFGGERSEGGGTDQAPPGGGRAGSR